MTRTRAIPEPSALTPSAERICAAAVTHFADAGYDGSSLTTIGALAGMRKASLYAHFANKDALFAEVLAIAIREELRAARDSFDAAPGHGLPGGEYLADLEPRYAASAHYRFLLRTVYAPPAALREEIIAAYRGFEDAIRELFVRALPEALSPQRAETLTHAYLGVIDSLQVELVFHSPEAYAARRAALWAVLASYADAALGEAGTSASR